MQIYAGADTRDDSVLFAPLYPSASWMTIIRRAWFAGRIVDYAATLGMANMSAVAITGHSRNGKQSLLAAAIDPRITAVVGSSPGTPITAPVRFSSAQFAGETVDVETPARGWWVPSLPSYLGRASHRNNNHNRKGTKKKGKEKRKMFDLKKRRG